MIIESKEVLEQLLAEGALAKNPQKKPRTVLMVSPEHFRIEYAINPYMTNEAGELNQVDEALALRQWGELKAIYESLGLKVEVLPGAPGLPDMVFCANQSFPFLDARGAKNVLLSNMTSKFRRGEVPYFRDWYEKRGYKVHELETKNVNFEGNGDAYFQNPRNIVWGGFGHRSSRAAYEELSERFGFYVVPLELAKEQYYHLDLCLSVVSEDTAIVVPDAFHEEGLAMIRLAFPNIIEVDAAENLRYACGNAHSPDGKHVITHKGAKDFVSRVRDAGLVPIETDTGEFFKSGGSVFCMKMMVF